MPNFAKRLDQIERRLEPVSTSLTPTMRLWYVSGDSSEIDATDFLRAQGRDLLPSDFIIHFQSAKDGKSVEEPLVDITDDFPK